MSELIQGSELQEGKEFIVLICDIDDIIQRIRDNDDQIFSDAEIKQAYQLARKKLTSLLMDDFWHGIDAMLNEVKTKS